MSSSREKQESSSKALPHPESTQDQLKLWQRLLKSGSSGADVYGIDVVWPGILNDDLIDLKPYFSDEIPQFFPTVLSSFTVQGKLVAIPEGSDIGLLFYRTDRIAAEALRNAFSHSQARNIEVALRYDDGQFRLHVRDDGKGIDPVVLSGQGREGHYGLPGMRERATGIGGMLAVWSELDAGTEVELTVPAAKAYEEIGQRSWFSRMLTMKHQ